MLCPEGYHVHNENTSSKEDKDSCKNKSNKMPMEGKGGIELNSYKNPKTWKKSLSSFFRNHSRPTKSNDGDRPSGSSDKFEGKEMSPDQKWQSLGKIFRRQSFENWNNASSQQGECSSTSKRLDMKKVLSSYFGKKNGPKDQ